jgi:damage-control phosphatase, subfamily III
MFLNVLFLQVALWGNKCDLSISAGAANDQLDIDPIGQALRLQPNILRDDTEVVRCHLANNRRTGRVDIILDNAGFELFTDLCLAELLTSSGVASSIWFHAKCIPWFVSDVTAADWEWTMDQLSSSSENFNSLNVLGELCRKRLADGVWRFTRHPFWTLPHDFTAMKTVAPDLFADLSGSDLIIFKGDLNYRKLVGDRLWPPTTPFSEALRGFGPAALCSLRTLKCDLVTGLDPGKAESAAAEASDWMLTGSYAVIQFAMAKSD